MKKTRTKNSKAKLPGFPGARAWETSWQKHWRKVGLPGYELPASEEGAARRIAVKAKVHTLGGFSAHAGHTDLLPWFSAVAPCKPRVALTHGEDKSRQALAAAIKQQYRLEPLLPAMNEVIDL